MAVELGKRTIEFIQSLSHDDLVCFLQVYSKASNEIDVATCEEVKKELLNKVSKEDTKLWDKEQ
jgi:hypothetical protein